MSIKLKLSFLISSIVTVILTLSICIYYYSSKSGLQEAAENQMATIAKQIGTSLKATEKSKKYLENTLGERLRAVSIAAEKQLDPHIANVRNEELVELSRKLGVDHISLWERKNGDIVVRKSSDPKELGLSSKTFGYWFTAFNQLFDDHQVTIPEGQKLPNFWSGPIQYSTSDPDTINKWGDYYDGTTDYMINPYINAKVFLNFEDSVGTNAVIRDLVKENEDIVEITGFDPRFFGKPRILKMKNGKLVYNLDVQEVPFGTYAFQDRSDVEHVWKTAQSGEIITATGEAPGRRLLKSFIPLGNGIPYIVGISFDYAAIEHALNRQLTIHIVISAGLILLAWMASYILAGFFIRPLQEVVRNVNAIAAGKFGPPIPVRSADELGVLSADVNRMAENLQAYMEERERSAEAIRRSEKLSVVGQLAAGVAHEIRNPLTTLRGFVQLQKQNGAVEDPYSTIMLSELDRINFIVSEFLVLAKPQANHYQAVRLDSILQNIIMLLDSQANLSNVSFETIFSLETPPVLCEVNQLKQVFVNLYKNAIEAMEDGGTVTTTIGYAQDDNMVFVQIVDQGCGIPEEDLPRLGEPFFTNKETGNGLGLMVSQSIIANHKGTMTIRSKPGEGACVEIRLPAAEDAGEEEDGGGSEEET